MTDTSNGSLVQIGGSYWRRISQSGSKAVPHPYMFQRYDVSASGGFFRPGDCIASVNWSKANTIAVNATNKSFFAQAGPLAGLAVSVMQRKQAYDMVCSRLIQFHSFLSAVRRGHLGKAARVLGVTHDPRSPSNWRSKSRSFSGTVLEYQFGWAPLLADVQDSYDTLTSTDLPQGVLRARGQSGVLTWTNGVVPSAYAYERVDETVRIVIQHRSVWSITGSDALLAYQLGFTNPWKAVVEVIPWSFLVGWFTNLETVLDALAPIHGVSFSQQALTRLTYYERKIEKREYFYGPVKTGYGKGFVFTRELVPLPGPSFSIKPFKGFSPERGLNAVSLVLQQLKRP